MAEILSAFTGSLVGVFGDGSDGSVTFDGVATFPNFATLVGSTYTLTRDMFATQVTINSGITVITASWRIFCTGTITVLGHMNNSGTSASASGGAAAGPTNALDGGAVGGNGTTTTGQGGQFFANTRATGGSGAGGNGASGSGGGGVGISGATSFLRSVGTILTGVWLGNDNPNHFCGGPGGGGGGGDGTNAGGGGGAGGGIVALIAHNINIANNSIVRADAGNGANAAAGNSGGGGGGGGGIIIGYSLSPWTLIGIVTVNGGIGGAGIGTGTAGTSGTAGTILNVVLQ